MKNTQQIKQLITMVIEDTCNILNIKPVIRFELADISNNRTAVYLSKDEALTVGRKYELIAVDENYATKCHELELIITIAHEVRHAYQKRHSQEFQQSFDNYKYVHTSSLLEYATQLVEVDAIAFSEVYIVLLTGKRFSLALPPEVREQVENRKTHIVESLQL